MRRVVVLAGGVGGAKFAHGVAATIGPDLTVIVNTADDVERHGLVVWPDHDTVMYTLAGIDDRTQGWGIRAETYAAIEQLAVYGEETWFRLGDRDLATHIARTARLRAGRRPTEVALGLQRSLGLTARVLPMTDAAVRTEILASDGWIDFQEYFVHRRQEPETRAVRFAGIETARPSSEVLEALAAADLVAVAPSNPIVSIGPILALPGVDRALRAARDRGAPVVAVSGIVGGKALKGPADRMLRSLGHESSALGVARLYSGWIDGFVVDVLDAGLAPAIEALGPATVVTDTLMADDAARARVATEVLTFGDRLRRGAGRPGKRG